MSRRVCPVVVSHVVFPPLGSPRVQCSLSGGLVLPRQSASVSRPCRTPMSGQADAAASPAPAPPAATPLPTGSLAGHTLGTQSLPGCDMAAQGSSGTTGSATTLPTAPTPLQLPSVIATSAPTPPLTTTRPPRRARRSCDAALTSASHRFARRGGCHAESVRLW